MKKWNEALGWKVSNGNVRLFIFCSSKMEFRGIPSLVEKKLDQALSSVFELSCSIRIDIPIMRWSTLIPQHANIHTHTHMVSIIDVYVCRTQCTPLSLPRPTFMTYDWQLKLGPLIFIFLCFFLRPKLWSYKVVYTHYGRCFCRWYSQREATFEANL